MAYYESISTPVPYDRDENGNLTGLSARFVIFIPWKSSETPCISAYISVKLASQLFGNSPEIAKKHYYTGLDLEEAKRVLES